MPTDPRTLLRASYRFRVEMGSGLYVYVGLGSQIKRLLEKKRILAGENGGMPIFCKTKLEFWPIVAIIVRPFMSAVFPGAFYCDKGKSHDMHASCKETDEDINLLQYTGIRCNYLDQSATTRAAAVIYDAPARSFVKKITNVNAY
uniref:Uncharacterized protein n=1 Tax=Schistocephalus solidus TaxID=70667 RepID=A0A0X3NLZ8_SCHSO